MLLDMFITYALLVYYNLYSDVQPQGRYLLPALIPFMYFVARGIERLFELIIKKESIRSVLYIIGAAILVFIAVYVYAGVFYPAMTG